MSFSFSEMINVFASYILQLFHFQIIKLFIKIFEWILNIDETLLLKCSLLTTAKYPLGEVSSHFVQLYIQIDYAVYKYFNPIIKISKSDLYRMEKK